MVDHWEPIKPEDFDKLRKVYPSVVPGVGAGMTTVGLFEGATIKDALDAVAKIAKIDLSNVREADLRRNNQAASFDEKVATGDIIIIARKISGGA